MLDVLKAKRDDLRAQHKQINDQITFLESQLTQATTKRVEIASAHNTLNEIITAEEAKLTPIPVEDETPQAALADETTAKKKTRK